jgi:hypothetical protein
MPRKKDRLTPEEEAVKLLEYHKTWTQSMNIITGNFQTLQNRTQIILTLATLTLTITGFSGPKIAASNVYSSVCMIGGLIFVLSSILLALVGTIKISWLTQIRAHGQKKMLISMIRERNLRTLLFRWMLIFLVIGLTLYVSSVVIFLIMGMNRIIGI